MRENHYGMLPVQLISAFTPSEEISRGISSLVISALRQVIILLPLASIIYLKIAEKKELIICDGKNVENKK